MTVPALQIVGLSKAYGAVQVLRDVSLECAAGSVHVLLGRNGSGKSTLLACASGRVRADHGSILMDGQRLLREPAWRRARGGLAWTFQDASPALTSSVADVLRAANGRGKAPVDLPASLQSALEPFVHEAWDRLSFGQRKLAALAAAAARRPRLLFLDEPVAGLAPPMREIVGKVVRQLAERGAAVLVVEHQREFIASFADEVSVISGGAIAMSGAPVQVLRRPDLFSALS